MNEAVSSPVPASVLEALARYDTPTICNAMEIVADYDVLVALSERGPLRINELGEALAWEQSRLSHQLRRMRGRGRWATMRPRTQAESARCEPPAWTPGLLVRKAPRCG